MKVHYSPKDYYGTFCKVQRMVPGLILFPIGTAEPKKVTCLHCIKHLKNYGMLPR